MIYSLSPQEEMLTDTTARRRFTLGCPDGRGEDSRFPLTPEAVAIFAEAGVEVMIQSGAGAPIHYSDSAYTAAGARVCDRASTIAGVDVVLSLPGITAAEVRTMRRGATLLTLSGSLCENLSAAREVLRQSVACVALDLLCIANHRPFADAMHQIEGCASIAIAASMLADSVDGKGILLGGVTGIAPCEVTVIGSGLGAIAAARRACGAGALVRLFDNNLQSLHQAELSLPLGALITSAMHPHVIANALRSADVVVLTPTSATATMPDNAESLLKAHALVFDLTKQQGKTFPSLEPVDMRRQRRQPSGRACFVNVSYQVPRTVAMALSNAMVQLVPSITASEQWHNLHTEALLALYGKPVNATLARTLGMRPIDPNILTSLS